MFSPPLYKVRKYPLSLLIKNNYNLRLDPQDDELYEIKQGDCMLFRQVRMISCDDSDTQRFVVFVDCGGGQNKPEAMKHLVEKGFKIGRQRFVMSERSASMVRTSILSFVESHIEPELNRRISMDIEFETTVLSKIICSFVE